MAKKTGSSLGEGLGGAIGLLKDALVPAVRAGVKQQFEVAMDAIEGRLLRLQGRLVKAFSGAVLLFLSGLSLAGALLFYLYDSLHVPRFVIALCLAALFGIAACVLYFTNRR